MTHVLICDNNPILSSDLQAQIASLYPDTFTIACCSSAEALRAEIAHKAPNIVLLDVLLGEENGIELAKNLFPHGSGVAVIFITGYIEYCTDVYETDHIYFLLKPIQPEQLRRALDKALAALSEVPGDFPVQINNTIRRVEISSVYSIESFYRKLRIRMAGEVLECYGSIAELPDNVRQSMIHCHKSFLVNPEHIRTLDRSTFLLTDGTTVPISRNRYAESRQAFLAYCGRHLEVH